MAVKKVATISRYIGLEADARPTGVAPGSTFLAYDTQILYVTHDGTNWVIKEYLHFGGAVYHNTDTAASDAARRFETSEKKLRDFVIQVATYAQLFGDSSAQAYRLEAGDRWGGRDIDISTLYFKNAGAGENGIVRIMAVEE